MTRSARQGARRSGRSAALVATLGAVALAGCGGANVQPSQENVDREIVQGTRSDDVSTVGDLLRSNREDGPAGQNLPVNKYLWRASLETLNFMPLASTDPFSGVIATDWAANPDAAGERFKVTVYISEPRLEARAVNVAVFRERRDGETWIPAEVSEATPRRLEDAILTRARQLRVADLEAGEG